MSRQHLARGLFFLGGGLTLGGLADAPVALALGLALALTLDNPFPGHTRPAAKLLLQWSVAGLGAGMNLAVIWSAGRSGFGFTVVTIVSVMVLGTLLGRWLRVERSASLLISAGTAICGGSAIAAVSSVIDADEQSISVSLGTVFILNAVALFIFPPLGHFFGLSQQAFGMWAAIAIHDTSSVVGAASHYGAAALQTATTVKLVRALWILPLTFGLGWLRRGSRGRGSFPWFILCFVGTAALHTWLPDQAVFPAAAHVARRGLNLSLFLIGCGMSRHALRAVGPRPLLQGVVLWASVATASLVAVPTFFS